MSMVKSESAASTGTGSLLRAAKAGNVEKLLHLLDEKNVNITTANSSGLNCLHLAAKEGHLSIVQELIKRNINVNSATKKGNTALHIAALAGKLDIVIALLENNADPNLIAQNAFTPLYMAAQEGHDDIVEHLLKNGANQSIATKDGFTPLAVALQERKDRVVSLLLDNDVKGRVKLPALHIAARKDDVKAAALLLQNDHSAEVSSKWIVNRTTESGFTALHIAAHYGNVGVASLLLNRGAAHNMAARNGITPLHVASKRGHTRFCAMLIDRDADLKAQTKDGLIPLHCAARSGHKPVVELLLEKMNTTEIIRTKNGLSALHMAVQGGHTDVIRLLINRGYPVDDTTLERLTSLHIASHCGHEKVAQLLLSRSAKVDAQAMNGFTPLHVACKKNQIQMVVLLLNRNANTETFTESGLTPLHVACFMGHSEIIKILLAKGAPLNTMNNRGETALHMAVRSGRPATVKYLLTQGAQPDLRKKESQTCLHLAARLNKLDIAKVLIEHQAKVDQSMENGYSPLHVACQEGHVDICELLIDSGASVKLKTNNGFTPLHLSSKYGRLAVTNLLLKKSASPNTVGKDDLTPLHVAAHYDNQDVALLLLKSGASPYTPAKNAYTPLHIAAKKNQIDIAISLMEYGATTGCKTRMGTTPLHLAAQAGHVDMCSLLAKDANVNDTAKFNLTPMHLAAEEDQALVVKLLNDNGALLDPLSKSGFTPLHVASHKGNFKAVECLLLLGARVNSKTKNGYTPLHLAAQQGHSQVVNLLLRHGALPDELTNNGHTALSLANQFGYITVVDTLTTVTTEITETQLEKQPLNIPETLTEEFMSEGSDDDDNIVVGGDENLTGKELQELGDDSIMAANNMELMTQTKTTEIDIGTENKRHSWTSSAGESDNCSVISKKISGFLVSFLVDARGGSMRGTRYPNLRIYVPPNACTAPTRITCRLAPKKHSTPESYYTNEELPLCEDEGESSRILDFNGKGKKFLEPIAIEIPHFASLRGSEREIVVIRSDDGEVWREHKQACSDAEFLKQTNSIDLETAEQLAARQIIRVITKDLPKYFALYSRTKEEFCFVGPLGGVLKSQTIQHVSATFPDKALTKEIKVGIQACPIPAELCKRAVGNAAKASPIVTVEPRRRKFHKPIVLGLPYPEGGSMKSFISTSEESSLRLLCSISGGTDPARWEDITGSTPLRFHEDHASFTTTVSAKFWLINCLPSADSVAIAERIFEEAMLVPYMARFVVLAKSINTQETKLRVFCITDEKSEKTLENQEHFIEIARSRDIEVLKGSSIFVECSGNVAVMKQTQPHCTFIPFRDNRLHFSVKVRDMIQEPSGRLSFYRDEKGTKVHGARKPLCNLNVTLPNVIEELESTETVDGEDSVSNISQAKEQYYLVDPDSVISTLEEKNTLCNTDGCLSPIDVAEVMGKLVAVQQILDPKSLHSVDQDPLKFQDVSSRSTGFDESSKLITHMKDSLHEVKSLLEQQKSHSSEVAKLTAWKENSVFSKSTKHEITGQQVENCSIEEASEILGDETEDTDKIHRDHADDCSSIIPENYKQKTTSYHAKESLAVRDMHVTPKAILSCVRTCQNMEDVETYIVRDIEADPEIISNQTSPSQQSDFENDFVAWCRESAQFSEDILHKAELDKVYEKKINNNKKHEIDVLAGFLSKDLSSSMNNGKKTHRQKQQHNSEVHEHITDVIPTATKAKSFGNVDILADFLVEGREMTSAVPSVSQSDKYTTKTGYDIKEFGKNVNFNKQIPVTILDETGQHTIKVWSTKKSPTLENIAANLSVVDRIKVFENARCDINDNMGQKKQVSSLESEMIHQRQALLALQNANQEQMVDQSLAKHMESDKAGTNILSKVDSRASKQYSEEQHSRIHVATTETLISDNSPTVDTSSHFTVQQLLKEFESQQMSGDDSNECFDSNSIDNQNSSKSQSNVLNIVYQFMHSMEESNSVCATDSETCKQELAQHSHYTNESSSQSHSKNYSEEHDVEKLYPPSDTTLNVKVIPVNDNVESNIQSQAESFKGALSSENLELIYQSQLIDCDESTGVCASTSDTENANAAVHEVVGTSQVEIHCHQHISAEGDVQLQADEDKSGYVIREDGEEEQKTSAELHGKDFKAQCNLYFAEDLELKNDSDTERVLEEVANQVLSAHADTELEPFVNEENLDHDTSKRMSCLKEFPDLKSSGETFSREMPGPSITSVTASCSRETPDLKTSVEMSCSKELPDLETSKGVSHSKEVLDVDPPVETLTPKEVLRFNTSTDIPLPKEMLHFDTSVETPTSNEVHDLDTSAGTSCSREALISGNYVENSLSGDMSCLRPDYETSKDTPYSKEMYHLNTSMDTPKSKKALDLNISEKTSDSTETLDLNILIETCCARGTTDLIIAVEPSHSTEMLDVSPSAQTSYPIENHALNTSVEISCSKDMFNQNTLADVSFSSGMPEYNASKETSDSNEMLDLNTSGKMGSSTETPDHETSKDTSHSEEDPNANISVEKANSKESSYLNYSWEGSHLEEMVDLNASVETSNSTETLNFNTLTETSHSGKMLDLNTSAETFCLRDTPDLNISVEISCSREMSDHDTSKETSPSKEIHGPNTSLEVFCSKEIPDLDTSVEMSHPREILDLNSSAETSCSGGMPDHETLKEMSHSGEMVDLDFSLKTPTREIPDLNSSVDTTCASAVPILNSSRKMSLSGEITNFNPSMTTSCLGEIIGNAIFTRNQDEETLMLTERSDAHGHLGCVKSIEHDDTMTMQRVADELLNSSLLVDANMKVESVNSNFSEQANEHEACPSFESELYIGKDDVAEEILDIQQTPKKIFNRSQNPCSAVDECILVETVSSCVSSEMLSQSNEVLKSTLHFDENTVLENKADIQQEIQQSPVKVYDSLDNFVRGSLISQSDFDDHALTTEHMKHPIECAESLPSSGCDIEEVATESNINEQVTQCLKQTCLATETLPNGEYTKKDVDIENVVTNITADNSSQSPASTTSKEWVDEDYAGHGVFSEQPITDDTVAHSVGASEGFVSDNKNVKGQENSIHRDIDGFTNQTLNKNRSKSKAMENMSQGTGETVHQAFDESLEIHKTSDTLKANSISSESLIEDDKTLNVYTDEPIVSDNIVMEDDSFIPQQQHQRLTSQTVGAALNSVDNEPLKRCGSSISDIVTEESESQSLGSVDRLIDQNLPEMDAREIHGDQQVSDDIVHPNSTTFMEIDANPLVGHSCPPEEISNQELNLHVDSATVDFDSCEQQFLFETSNQEIAHATSVIDSDSVGDTAEGSGSHDQVQEKLMVNYTEELIIEYEQHNHANINVDNSPSIQSQVLSTQTNEGFVAVEKCTSQIFDVCESIASDSMDSTCQQEKCCGYAEKEDLSTQLSDPQTKSGSENCVENSKEMLSVLAQPSPLQQSETLKIGQESFSCEDVMNQLCVYGNLANQTINTQADSECERCSSKGTLFESNEEGENHSADAFEVSSCERFEATDSEELLTQPSSLSYVTSKCNDDKEGLTDKCYDYEEIPDKSDDHACVPSVELTGGFLTGKMLDDETMYDDNDVNVSTEKDGYIGHGLFQKHDSEEVSHKCIDLPVSSRCHDFMRNDGTEQISENNANQMHNIGSEYDFVKENVVELQSVEEALVNMPNSDMSIQRQGVDSIAASQKMSKETSSQFMNDQIHSQCCASMEEDTAGLRIPEKVVDGSLDTNAQLRYADTMAESVVWKAMAENAASQLADDPKHPECGDSVEEGVTELLIPKVNSTQLADNDFSSKYLEAMTYDLVEQDNFGNASCNLLHEPVSPKSHRDIEKTTFIHQISEEMSSQILDSSVEFRHKEPIHDKVTEQEDSSQLPGSGTKDEYDEILDKVTSTQGGSREYMTQLSDGNTEREYKEIEGANAIRQQDSDIDLYHTRDNYEKSSHDKWMHDSNSELELFGQEPGFLPDTHIISSSEQFGVGNAHEPRDSELTSKSPVSPSSSCKECIEEYTTSEHQIQEQASFEILDASTTFQCGQLIHDKNMKQQYSEQLPNQFVHFHADFQQDIDQCKTENTTIRKDCEVIEEQIHGSDMSSNCLKYREEKTAEQEDYDDGLCQISNINDAPTQSNAFDDEIVSGQSISRPPSSDSSDSRMNSPRKGHKDENAAELLLSAEISYKMPDEDSPNVHVSEEICDQKHNLHASSICGTASTKSVTLQQNFEEVSVESPNVHNTFQSYQNPDEMCSQFEEAGVELETHERYENAGREDSSEELSMQQLNVHSSMQPGFDDDSQLFDTHVGLLRERVEESKLEHGVLEHATHQSVGALAGELSGYIYARDPAEISFQMTDYQESYDNNEMMPENSVAGLHFEGVSNQLSGAQTSFECEFDAEYPTTQCDIEDFPSQLMSYTHNDETGDDNTAEQQDSQVSSQSSDFGRTSRCDELASINAATPQFYEETQSESMHANVCVNAFVGQNTVCHQDSNDQSINIHGNQVINSNHPHIPEVIDGQQVDSIAFRSPIGITEIMVDDNTRLLDKAINVAESLRGNTGPANTTYHKNIDDVCTDTNESISEDVFSERICSEQQAIEHIIARVGIGSDNMSEQPPALANEACETYPCQIDDANSISEEESKDLLLSPQESSSCDGSHTSIMNMENMIDEEFSGIQHFECAASSPNTQEGITENTAENTWDEMPEVGLECDQFVKDAAVANILIEEQVLDDPSNHTQYVEETYKYEEHLSEMADRDWREKSIKDELASEITVDGSLLKHDVEDILSDPFSEDCNSTAHQQDNGLGIDFSNCSADLFSDPTALLEQPFGTLVSNNVFSNKDFSTFESPAMNTLPNDSKQSMSQDMLKFDAIEHTTYPDMEEGYETVISEDVNEAEEQLSEIEYTDVNATHMETSVEFDDAPNSVVKIFEFDDTTCDGIEGISSEVTTYSIDKQPVHSTEQSESSGMAKKTRFGLSDNVTASSSITEEYAAANFSGISQIITVTSEYVSCKPNCKSQTYTVPEYHDDARYSQSALSGEESKDSSSMSREQYFNLDSEQLGPDMDEKGKINLDFDDGIRSTDEHKDIEIDKSTTSRRISTEEMSDINSKDVMVSHIDPREECDADIAISVLSVESECSDVSSTKDNSVQQDETCKPQMDIFSDHFSSFDTARCANVISAEDSMATDLQNLKSSPLQDISTNISEEVVWPADMTVAKVEHTADKNDDDSSRIHISESQSSDFDQCATFQETFADSATHTESFSEDIHVSRPDIVEHTDHPQFATKEIDDHGDAIADPASSPSSVLNETSHNPIINTRIRTLESGCDEIKTVESNVNEKQVEYDDLYEILWSSARQRRESDDSLPAKDGDVRNSSSDKSVPVEIEVISIESTFETSHSMHQANTIPTVIITSSPSDDVTPVVEELVETESICSTKNASPSGSTFHINMDACEEADSNVASQNAGVEITPTSDTTDMSTDSLEDETVIFPMDLKSPTESIIADKKIILDSGGGIANGITLTKETCDSCTFPQLSYNNDQTLDPNTDVDIHGFEDSISNMSSDSSSSGEFCLVDRDIDDEVTQSYHGDRMSDYLPELLSFQVHHSPSEYLAGIDEEKAVSYSIQNASETSDLSRTQCLTISECSFSDCTTLKTSTPQTDSNLNKDNAGDCLVDVSHLQESVGIVKECNSAKDSKLVQEPCASTGEVAGAESFSFQDSQILGTVSQLSDHDCYSENDLVSNSAPTTYVGVSGESNVHRIEIHSGAELEYHEQITMTTAQPLSPSQQGNFVTDDALPHWHFQDKHTFETYDIAKAGDLGDSITPLKYEQGNIEYVSENDPVTSPDQPAYKILSKISPTDTTSVVWSSAVTGCVVSDGRMSHGNDLCKGVSHTSSDSLAKHEDQIYTERSATEMINLQSSNHQCYTETDMVSDNKLRISDSNPEQASHLMKDETSTALHGEYHNVGMECVVHQATRVEEHTDVLCLSRSCQSEIVETVSSQKDRENLKVTNDDCVASVLQHGPGLHESSIRTADTQHVEGVSFLPEDAFISQLSLADISHQTVSQQKICCVTERTTMSCVASQNRWSLIADDADSVGLSVKDDPVQSEISSEFCYDGNTAALGNSQVSSSFTNNTLKLYTAFRAIASEIGLQWMELARELDMTESTVWNIQKECGGDIGEKGFCLLSVWHEKNREKCDCELVLRDVLLKMGRADLTRHLRSDLSFLKSPQYKHDDSAFSDLAYDLGTPRGTPYHVSTPYPFKNEPAEIINYEKEPVPLCYSEHDDDDDPNKPHFVYPEDAYQNSTNSAQYHDETNGIESFPDDIDYDERLEQEVKQNLVKCRGDGNGYVEELNGAEIEIPGVMITGDNGEDLEITRHVLTKDVSDV